MIALLTILAAAAPEGEANASASLGSGGLDSNAEADADADAEASEGKRIRDRRKDQKWIKRWAPERNMVELGLFGGIAFPSRDLELFEADRTLPDQGFKPLRTIAPDIGGRFGYYPSRFLGLELEGAVLPTATDPGDDSAIVWAFRGHVVGQLGLWSVTPFVLAGPSALGVASQRSALGNDVDLGFHFGGGLKIFATRYLAFRFDVRDTLTAKRGIADGVGHTIELLGGISLTLNRKRREAPAPPGDRDGDGILDPDDHCIDTPGIRRLHGCPVGDRDGDGILDPDDACIDTPGVPEYDGCPIPDTDGDGILDPDDACIDTPGVPEYDGCPIPDTDGDGILDPDDACVEEPETKNGFKDEDGCPDEVPKEVEKFTGVIEGIFFDTNRATIKAKSRTKLDNAVKVLKDFPTVRLEISGHTDNRGADDYNEDLSARRADAVKDYLVEHGIAADRLETRGAGELEPRDTNKTKKGRANNRRIEFRLLSQ